MFTYDRRGHSQSERLQTQGSIEEVVADLGALITAKDLAPAHVAGNSFGAAITLKLAARPNLFASATAHEPPLMGMLGDNQLPTNSCASLRSSRSAADCQQRKRLAGRPTAP